MCVDDFDWLWNFPLFNFSRHWGIFLPNIFHSRRTHFKLTSRFFLSCRTTSSSVRYFHPVESKSEKSEEGTSELKWEILKWKEKKTSTWNLRPVRKLAELRHWMETRTAQEKERIEKLDEQQLSSSQPKWNIRKQVKASIFMTAKHLNNLKKPGWNQKHNSQHSVKIDLNFLFFFHFSRFEFASNIQHYYNLKNFHWFFHIFVCLLMPAHALDFVVYFTPRKKISSWATLTAERGKCSRKMCQTDRNIFHNFHCSHLRIFDEFFLFNFVDTLFKVNIKFTQPKKWNSQRQVKMEMFKEHRMHRQRARQR